MAHNHTHGSPYSRLAERLNRFPQGAPESKLLFDILKILMTEKEAGLMAQLPIKPFSARQAAEIWNLSDCEAQKVLDELARRAILVDIEQDGKQIYAVPPPMAGFFEFSLMRVREDIDQKTLSELFHQYITVEEDFMRDLVRGGDIQMGRIFPQEPQIPDEYALHVLDYERATNVIDTASDIGVSMCYCRHKALHAGTVCDAPMDICMTFNTTAATLIKHGHARRVEAGVPRPARAGLRPQPRTVRRERQAARQLYLQLLLLLLRGAARDKALRSRADDLFQLHLRDRNGKMRRLRQVPEDLPHRRDRDDGGKWREKSARRSRALHRLRRLHQALPD